MNKFLLGTLLFLMSGLSAFAGDWNVGNFADVFGDPTGDKLVWSQIKGTFSNSATTNSKLRVGIIITLENDISIELYEYGNSKVKALWPVEYLFKFKHKDKIVKFYVKMKKNSYRIHIDNSSNPILLEYLTTKTGYLKVVIINKLTEYKFKLNCDGVSETLAQIKK